jgi:hypothetical protein
MALTLFFSEKSKKQKQTKDGLGFLDFSEKNKVSSMKENEFNDEL